MKHFLLVGLLLYSFYVSAQNDASHPCITSEEYKILEQQISQSAVPVQARTSAVSLSWPLRPANGLNDCSYYFIAAYVDQDTTATNIRDFNCGNNTYDGHHGTDIATWPYNFYKMDNNLVEVIAAAAGTIVQKADGNFDRNCSGNNLTANSIIIQHADGSYALYWHMKKKFSDNERSRAVGSRRRIPGCGGRFRKCFRAASSF